MQVKAKNIITLNNLPLNQTGIVHHIDSKNNIKRRLLDLGIIEGTKIHSLFSSPFGNPTAYEIRGFLIALRNEDSSKIYVEKDGEY